MPFDGTPTSALSVLEHRGAQADFVGHGNPTRSRPRSMPAGHVSRRPDSIASTIAVLRRARDLVADERRWGKGSFVRSWFDVPVLPQMVLARRFCAIGAIMRAGRELQLWTRNACLALQWQTVQPVEGWNDAPARTHADVIAAFDAALMAVEESGWSMASGRSLSNAGRQCGDLTGGSGRVANRLAGLVAKMALPTLARRTSSRAAL